jgi:hypothetical protein
MDSKDPPAKRTRFNPIGENVYLLHNERIHREKDIIIEAQRIWRERAYAPPGTLFASRGIMYEKFAKDFHKLANV